MNSVRIWLFVAFLLIGTFGEAFAQTVQIIPPFPSQSDSISAQVVTQPNIIGTSVGREGSVIRVTIQHGGINVSPPPSGSAIVQLGTFPAGRYSIEFYEVGNQFTNATLAFLSEVTVSSQYITLIEFSNNQRNTYFMSADPIEVAQYDGLAGWARTGKSFKVWPFVDTPNNPYAGFLNPPTVPSYALRACKFLNGQSGSAFYNAMFEECVFLKQLQQQANPSTFNGWSYQGIAFAALPTRAGQCELGARPVYRAYNNGHVTGNANHRWTDDASVYQQMLLQGWTGDGAAFCVPF